MTLSSAEAASTVARLIRSDMLTPVETNDFGLWLDRNYNQYDLLSSGEQVLFNAAWALWNGSRACALSDLTLIDAPNRAVVLDAVSRCWGAA